MHCSPKSCAWTSAAEEQRLQQSSEDIIPFREPSRILERGDKTPLLETKDKTLLLRGQVLGLGRDGEFLGNLYSKILKYCDLSFFWD